MFSPTWRKHIQQQLTAGCSGHWRAKSDHLAMHFQLKISTNVCKEGWYQPIQGQRWTFKVSNKSHPLLKTHQLVYKLRHINFTPFSLFLGVCRFPVAGSPSTKMALLHFCLVSVSTVSNLLAPEHLPLRHQQQLPFREAIIHPLSTKRKQTKPPNKERDAAILLQISFLQITSRTQIFRLPEHQIILPQQDVLGKGV